MLKALTSAYAVGVSSRLVMQIIAFVQVMIASRFLDLTQFGIYALAWAAAVIANSFVYTGFYQALLRSPQIDRDRDTIFWVMCAIGGAGTAVIAAIGWIAGAGQGGTALALVMLAPIPLLRVPVAWNEAQLIRAQRVRVASAHVALAEACALCVVWYGLRAGYGVEALIAARYTATSVELLVTTALMRRRPRFAANRTALRDTARTALPLWATSAMGMFTNYGADLILGAFLNPAAVGAYRGGSRIAQTVTDLIMQPLVMLSWSRFTQLEKQDRSAEMRTAWLDNMRFGAAAMWPILVCVALLSADIVLVVFDETWLPAAPIIAILCTARAIRFLTSLLEPTMICNHQAAWQLRIRFTAVVILLVCLLGFGRFSGEAAAFSHVFTGVIVAALSVHAMLSVLQIRLGTALAAFAPGAVLAAICAGFVIATTGWRAAQSPAMGLFATVGTLVVIWVLLVVLSLRRGILILPRP